MRGIRAAALALTGALLVVPAAVPAPAAASDAVIGKRKIGESVQDRAIMAYRLGQKKKRNVVLFSTMHGNESKTRRILLALRHGKPIAGVDLWVVPTYNPDGLAAGTRKNAHGVDLNRNFPYQWADLDGNYESGPEPKSEPETRAVMKFLRKIKPVRILSFHQPLHGVDLDTKNKKFGRRVARKLKLPKKTFDCGGVCHGTMTSWYNHNFKGAALTVEYGADPSNRTLRRVAPRRVLKVFGARWRHLESEII